jgi:hypothetical protein
MMAQPPVRSILPQRAIANESHVIVRSQNKRTQSYNCGGVGGGAGYSKSRAPLTHRRPRAKAITQPPPPHAPAHPRVLEYASIRENKTLDGSASGG